MRRPLPLVLLWPLLAACGPSDGESASVSAWNPDLGATTAGLLEPAVLESAATGVLGQLLGLNYAALMDLYADRMTLRADGCPTVDLVDSGGGLSSDSWYTDGCVTESGDYFWGQIFGAYQVEVAHDDGYTYTGAEWKGWGAVTDAGGASFSLGGFVQLYEAWTGDGTTLHQSRGRGDVLWTGSGWEDTWFATGLRPALSLDAWWDGAPRVRVHGTAAGFSGDVVAVEATDLYAGDAATGWPCPGELGGTLALRDTAGTWYEVAFDGATSADDVVDASVCDGCGVARVEGVEVGQICLSPAPLLAWEEAPW